MNNKILKFKFNKTNNIIAKKIIDKYPKKFIQSAILPLLHLAQEQSNGWLNKSTIEYIKGYADGVNYWAALNPSKVDQSMFPVTEIDLLKGMVFQMPLFYGFDHNIDELMSLMSDNNEEMSSVNSLSDNVTVAKIKSHFKPIKTRSAKDLMALRPVVRHLELRRHRHSAARNRGA